MLAKLSVSGGMQVTKTWNWSFQPAFIKRVRRRQRAFLSWRGGGLDHFQGRLAILGPFQSKAQMREGFGQGARALAARGVAVVWIQAPLARHDPLRPSFYTVPEGSGAVVVAQADLVADLANKPQA